MSSTIKDVAKLAKVSIASVSKALNGEKGVGAETRERIMNAAKILGYAPNARAVSFSRQEAHAVLFVYRSYPDDPFTNPYVYSLFDAILESLTESHYRFAALNVNNLANPSETVKSLMAGKAYDGAIIHANALDKELLAQIRLNKFPAILIGRDKYVNWLDTNHVLAGRAAANYLLNRGYSRFAMKPIPKDGAVGNVLGLFAIYSKQSTYSGGSRDYAQYQITVSRIEDLDFKAEDLLSEEWIEANTPAESYDPPVADDTGDDLE